MSDEDSSATEIEKDSESKSKPAKSKMEVKRTISSYDLTSADNPGSIIAYPLLKTHNYDEWSCSMETALLSRKKFRFLDGTIPKPPKDFPDYDDWRSVNALLISWIKMSIDPSLKSNITHRDNARDLWKHLKKRFSVTNGPKNQKIKAELATCKQSNARVEEYYGRLTKIWENINNYRPVRVCDCGMCICNLGQKQEKDREDDMVQQFLFGLDEKIYHTVRSNLCAKDPLPSLEEAYNNVSQEEEMLSQTKFRDEATEAITLAVQTRSKFRNLELEKGVPCKHCGRTCHISERCFEVVGYPDWWKDKGRGQGFVNHGRGRNNRGNIGGGRGNSSSSRTTSLNAVSTNSGNEQQVNRVITDKDREAVSGLTDEQWKGVMTILNAARAPSERSNPSSISDKSSNISWILDSGATHHMTSEIGLLEDMRTIDPVIVILADGRQRIANRERTIKFNQNLTLKSVFYVLELQSNLIFVGQLMDDNSCVAQMSDSFLIIQDLNTRTVIGVGKRFGGSFYFINTSSVRAITVKESYEL